MASYHIGSAGTSSTPGKCAIHECQNPCFVDASGIVHDCCGYTHAMEHIRRQTIMKRGVGKQIKGVTHCLLPECNEVTWPFMNYCGKTHAAIGKLRGLVPPKNGVSRPKDSSMCDLPGCFRPKYKENGKVFDFCGKKHATQAREKRGQVKTTNEQLVAKDDTVCIIPECTESKCRDPVTGKEHDYCGRRHADEAKKRGIKPPPPPLTSRSDVDKFLKNFSVLKIKHLQENEHAKSGGVLYNKFITAKNALPECDQKTCLAFHGTPEENIPNICQNGYDSSRRSRQLYGSGEYFAMTPDTPLSFCSGGKKMLLNELLLGQEGVHHTKSGDIVVMKNPEHDLPRFIITFE